MDRNIPCWFAVYTRSRHEKQVDSLLKERGVETFLPLIKTLSRRRDRKKFVDLPLFPGYLFVHISRDNLYEVTATHGVVRIVGSDPFTPVPIGERQINDIRVLVTSDVKLDPYRYLTNGTRVRINAGPLVGVEGILLKRKTGYRVVVSIDLLQRSVAAEVCVADVEPID